jgi:hypothetical protein
VHIQSSIDIYMAVRTTEIIVRPFFYLENHHVHVIKHRSPRGYRDY